MRQTVRLLAIVIVAGFPGQFVAWAEEPSLAETFRELSAEIPFLNLGEVLYDRSGDRSTRALLTDGEAAAVATFWKKAKGASGTGLRDALRDRDAKVRTMALAAAHWSGEPQRWLPDIVALAGDDAPTFPSVSLRAAFAIAPQGEDPLARRKREQMVEKTVGEFATAIAKMYLGASGYGYGIPGSPPRHPGFADYWAKRKQRDHCLGWFAVGLQVASQGSSPMGEDRLGLVAELRARIDKLPSPDREWILLSLAAPWEGGAPEAGGAALATHDDLVAALKRLGRDPLLALFRSDQISEDPDMQIAGGSPGGAFNCDRVTLFALRNITAVLEEKHAQTLLDIGGRQLALKAAEEFHFATPRWAIAAADLEPARAAEILRAALQEFREGSSVDDQDNRAMIAIALWEHLGADAIDEVADWFFAETPSRGAGGFGRHRMCAYLWADAHRELLVHLAGEARLEKLDWGSLAKLVAAANQHVAEPVVSDLDFRKAWHPYGEAHYGGKIAEAKEKYPKETAELERNLAEWRTKLRAFAKGA